MPFIRYEIDLFEMFLIWKIYFVFLLTTQKIVKETSVYYNESTFTARIGSSRIMVRNRNEFCSFTKMNDKTFQRDEFKRFF